MSGGSVPAKYREPHYSTRLFRAQYQYLAKFYDKGVFEEACSSLGMPVDFMLKDDNWVSDWFLRDFMEKVRRATREENLAEKFGRFAVSRDAVNFIEYTVNESLLFPALFYLAVPSQYGRYNNVNRVSLISWRPGHFEYRMMPKGEIVADVDVCDNTVGVLSGTQVLYGLDEISVRHTRCIHRGDTSCDFIVDYKSRAFWRRRLIQITKFGLFGVLFAFLMSWWNTEWSRTTKALFSLSYLFAGATYFIGERYYRVLRYIQQYNEQSKSRAAELHDNYARLDRKYNESLLLRELSIKLSETVAPKEVLTMCLRDLDRRFGYSRSLIMLLSTEKDLLYTAEATGFGSDMDRIFQLSVRYPADRNNPQFFAKILETGVTSAIFDVAKFKSSLRPQNRALIDSFGVQSIIVSPIQDKDQKYGLLVVGSTQGDRVLNQDDRAMIESICQLLSLSFQRARNFDREKNLRTLFQKYVPAMVLEGIQTLTPESGELAPKASPIGSMFVDLRDFTSRCQKLPPEKIVEMMNLYTTYVTDRIAAAGGIIDKLVGDGVNAFFPSFEKSGGRHAKACLVSAAYLLADLKELDEEFVARGFGSAAIGIGLHVGPAVVGNMGCDRKLDYTAVGDTVNVAARLQELSKKYRDLSDSGARGTILLTRETYEAAGVEIATRSVGEVTIRGRDRVEDVLFIDVESCERWVISLDKDYRNAMRIIDSGSSPQTAETTSGAPARKVA